MSFKEIAQSSGSCLLYLAGLALYVIGGIHSQRKHDEGSAAWWIPPLGIYRGVESFWHKDPQINWTSKHDTDIRSVVYLITESSYSKANVAEVNNSIQQFADKIKDYPIKEKKYLEAGARCFIDFNISATHDVVDSMDRFMEVGILNFKYSPHTDSIRNILIDSFKLKDIVGELDDKMKEEAKEMSSSSNKKYTSKEVAEMKKSLKLAFDIYLPKTIDAMKRGYKNIFNAEY